MPARRCHAPGSLVATKAGLISALSTNACSVLASPSDNVSRDLLSAPRNRSKIGHDFDALTLVIEYGHASLTLDQLPRP